MFLLAVRNGFVKGIKTALMLLKIMIPIYLIVVIIKHTPLFNIIADFFRPAMSLFNLPGDAVIPIISGIFGDEYAVIAAMGAFSFDKAMITTIAMIVLCCHSIPVETAITHRIGMPAWKIAVFRFVLAVFTGIFVGFLGGLFL